MSDQRTKLQNKAMWKYFEILANSLNDAGLDMRKTLKPEIDIPWNKDSIHDHLWIPIQEAMTGKESTTEMDTKTPSKVYEVLNRHLGEKFGISVEWPSHLNE